jgi:low affinity Fe/Cu permease
VSGKTARIRKAGASARRLTWRNTNRGYILKENQLRRIVMDDDAAARPSLSDRFSRAAQWTSQQCGRAYTFIAAILVILLWAASGPAFGYSDTWQLIINTGTTIITFLMVFLIQNTQNRDTTAIQLKLDELIRANENAQNRMMKLEDLTENQIKQLKENLAPGPPEAIREPLEAAQQGLTEVSGDIQEAKSRLAGRRERT